MQRCSARRRGRNGSEPTGSPSSSISSTDEARTVPGCVQRPRIPFAVAAAGPRAMRLATTYGETWVTTGDLKREGPVRAADGAKMIREQIARLDEVCVETGRDPASLRRLLLTGP